MVSWYCQSSASTVGGAEVLVTGADVRSPGMEGSTGSGEDLRVAGAGASLMFQNL